MLLDENAQLFRRGMKLNYPFHWKVFKCCRFKCYTPPVSFCLLRTEFVLGAKICHCSGSSCLFSQILGPSRAQPEKRDRRFGRRNGRHWRGLYYPTWLVVCVLFLLLFCAVVLFELNITIVLTGLFSGWRRSEKSSFPDSNEPEEKESNKQCRAQLVAPTTWPVGHRLSWGKYTGKQDAHIFLTQFFCSVLPDIFGTACCNVADINLAMILTNSKLNCKCAKCYAFLIILGRVV